jgi:hypothetical protein
MAPTAPPPTAMPPPAGPDGRGFIRFAGLAAILSGIGTVIYSIAFIGLVVLELAPEPGQLVSALALQIGGVLSVVAFAGVYRWLLEVESGSALLALLLGALGGIGAAIHGGYDLAVALHPPGGDLGAVGALPNPIDPRGLLTFGAAGLAALVASSLILRSRRLPRVLLGDRPPPAGLGYLGYLAGVLLVVVYLGRLIILEPTNPLVAGPAALVGFLVAPAWYVWLGLTMRAQPAPLGVRRDS